MIPKTPAHHDGLGDWSTADAASETATPKVVSYGNALESKKACEQARKSLVDDPVVGKLMAEGHCEYIPPPPVAK